MASDGRADTGHQHHGELVDQCGQESPPERAGVPTVGLGADQYAAVETEEYAAHRSLERHCHDLTLRLRRSIGEVATSATASRRVGRVSATR